MTGRVEVRKTYKMYVGGEFVRSESGRSFMVGEEVNEMQLARRATGFRPLENKYGLGDVEQRAEEVSTLFMRIARAVRIINDERASLPDLPQTKPEHLSFLVAAAMELETEVKLELLELRYTSERLKRLRDLLARATPNYEERARIHAIAKQNGHGGKKIDLE